MKPKKNGSNAKSRPGTAAQKRAARGRGFKNAAAARAARRKVDPVEKAIDNMMTNVRRAVAEGLAELVQLGVRARFEDILGRRVPGRRRIIAIA